MPSIVSTIPNDPGSGLLIDELQLPYVIKIDVLPAVPEEQGDDLPNSGGLAYHRQRGRAAHESFLILTFTLGHPATSIERLRLYLLLGGAR